MKIEPGVYFGHVEFCLSTKKIRCLTTSNFKPDGQDSGITQQHEDCSICCQHHPMQLFIVRVNSISHQSTDSDGKPNFFDRLQEEAVLQVKEMINTKR